MKLTNQEIEELTTCPKIIINAPKKEPILRQGSWHNGFKLESLDSKYQFSVYTRINEKFEENFSVGLIYKNTHLIRCNGIHGVHKNKIINNNEFNVFHIHKATQEVIEQELDSCSDAQLTNEYATFEEALFFFIKHINITNADEYPYLSNLSQFTLDM